MKYFKLSRFFGVLFGSLSLLDTTVFAMDVSTIQSYGKSITVKNNQTYHNFPEYCVATNANHTQCGKSTQLYVVDCHKFKKFQYNYAEFINTLNRRKNKILNKLKSAGVSEEGYKVHSGKKVELDYDRCRDCMDELKDILKYLGIEFDPFKIEDASYYNYNSSYVDKCMENASYYDYNLNYNYNSSYVDKCIESLDEMMIDSDQEKSIKTAMKLNETINIKLYCKELAETINDYCGYAYFLGQLNSIKRNLRFYNKKTVKEFHFCYGGKYGFVDSILNCDNRDGMYGFCSFECAMKFIDQKYANEKITIISPSYFEKCRGCKSIETWYENFERKFNYKDPKTNYWKILCGKCYFNYCKICMQKSLKDKEPEHHICIISEEDLKNRGENWSYWNSPAFEDYKAC